MRGHPGFARARYPWSSNRRASSQQQDAAELFSWDAIRTLPKCWFSIRVMVMASGKKNTAAFPHCSPQCKIRVVPCRGTKIHGRTLFDEIPCPQQTGIGKAWKTSSPANNMHRISEYIRTESIYPACQMKPFVPTCPRSGSINKGS